MGGSRFALRNWRVKEKGGIEPEFPFAAEQCINEGLA